MIKNSHGMEYKAPRFLRYLIIISIIVTLTSLIYYMGFPTTTYFYVQTNCNYTVSNRSNPIKTSQKRANAFILTSVCNGFHYNTTLSNLERSFPNFFYFRCYKGLPLNDSHVHPTDFVLFKKFSAILVSSIQIWTYEMPKYASSELEWSFFFEDDINIIDPGTAIPVMSKWLNYTPILQELMYNKEVQEKHGLFYLGICGPTFNFTDRPLRSSSATDQPIFHYKGYGYCGHALAFTTQRARSFWTEISLYRPAAHNSGTDQYIRDYCIRSGSKFYTFGANKHWPPQTGHYGLVFQDRGVFSTTVH